MRQKRKDRDGLYQQPGSANWYASYTDATGKRRRRSTGTDSRPEAATILSQWRLQAHQKQVFGTEPPHSLHELMLAYIDAHSNKRSLERDGYSIQHLDRLIGENREISGLTIGDIYAYQQTRATEGAAPGTINREVGLLSAALNWAGRAMGWKVGNPATGKRRPEPPGRERWLTRRKPPVAGGGRAGIKSTAPIRLHHPGVTYRNEKRRNPGIGVAPGGPPAGSNPAGSNEPEKREAGDDSAESDRPRGYLITRQVPGAPLPGIALAILRLGRPPDRQREEKLCRCRAPVRDRPLYATRFTTDVRELAGTGRSADPAGITPATAFGYSSDRSGLCLPPARATTLRRGGAGRSS